MKMCEVYHYYFFFFCYFHDMKETEIQFNIERNTAVCMKNAIKIRAGVINAGAHDELVTSLQELAMSLRRACDELALTIFFCHLIG